MLTELYENRTMIEALARQIGEEPPPMELWTPENGKQTLVNSFSQSYAPKSKKVEVRPTEFFNSSYGVNLGYKVLP